MSENDAIVFCCTLQDAFIGRTKESHVLSADNIDRMVAKYEPADDGAIEILSANNRSMVDPQD